MFFIISIFLLASSFVMYQIRMNIECNRVYLIGSKEHRRTEIAYVCNVILFFISIALFIFCASLLETVQACGSMPFEFLNNHIYRWWFYFDNESVLNGFHVFLKGLFAVYLPVAVLHICALPFLIYVLITNIIDYYDAKKNWHSSF